MWCTKKTDEINWDLTVLITNTWLCTGNVPHMIKKWLNIMGTQLPAPIVHMLICSYRSNFVSLMWTQPDQPQPVQLLFHSPVLFTFQWPRRCESSYRSAVPLRLFHQGCYSTRVYRPRYCGVCTDGRCCSPYRTRTVIFPFRCWDGRQINQPVMIINSCVCHYNCPYSSDTSFRSPAVWG